MIHNNSNWMYKVLLEQLFLNRKFIKNTLSKKLVGKNNKDWFSDFQMTFYWKLNLSNKLWSFWNNWLIIFHSIHFPVSNMLPKVFRIRSWFFFVSIELQIQKMKHILSLLALQMKFIGEYVQSLISLSVLDDLSCPAPPLLINMWFEVLGHPEGCIWRTRMKILIPLCSTFARLQGNRNSSLITYCKQKGKMFKFEMDMWLRCLVPGDQQRGHSTESIKKPKEIQSVRDWHNIIKLYMSCKVIGTDWAH